MKISSRHRLDIEFEGEEWEALLSISSNKGVSVQNALQTAIDNFLAEGVQTPDEEPQFEI